MSKKFHFFFRGFLAVFILGVCLLFGFLFVKTTYPDLPKAQQPTPAVTQSGFQVRKKTCGCCTKRRARRSTAQVKAREHSPVAPQTSVDSPEVSE